MPLTTGAGRAARYRIGAVPPRSRGCSRALSDRGRSGAASVFAGLVWLRLALVHLALVLSVLTVLVGHLLLQLRRCVVMLGFSPVHLAMRRAWRIGAARFTSAPGALSRGRCTLIGDGCARVRIIGVCGVLAVHAPMILLALRCRQCELPEAVAWARLCDGSSRLGRGRTAREGRTDLASGASPSRQVGHELLSRAQLGERRRRKLDVHAVLAALSAS
jgi:hypothetical protein